MPLDLSNLPDLDNPKEMDAWVKIIGYNPKKHFHRLRTKYPNEDNSKIILEITKRDPLREIGKEYIIDKKFYYRLDLSQTDKLDLIIYMLENYPNYTLNQMIREFHIPKTELLELTRQMNETKYNWFKCPVCLKITTKEQEEKKKDNENKIMFKCDCEFKRNMGKFIELKGLSPEEYLDERKETNL